MDTQTSEPIAAEADADCDYVAVEVRVVAVDPGAPNTVDAEVAGVRLRAEWIGQNVRPGDLVDVELEIDDVLGWNDTIATADAESQLREGPRLAGTVEDQDQQLLILRIADGLLQVEVDDGPGPIQPGTSVVMVVDDLKLYPTGT